VTLELLNKILRGYIILKKNDVVEDATEDRIKKIEDDIISMANILTNIMLIGKQKQKKCLFFSGDEGICRYWRFDVEVPTLNLIKREDGYYVNTLQHPEFCAVCSYWREGVLK